MRLASFLRPKSQSLLTAVGLLLLRVVAGAYFISHGWGKIQHPFSWGASMGIPPLFQGLAALAEFGGGIAWILGLLTPLASLGLACTMAVAFSMSKAELAAVYFCVAVLLLLAGPGRFSADAYVFREKKAA